MRQILANAVISILLMGHLGCNDSINEHPLKIKINSKAYVSLEFKNVIEPFDFRFNYWPNFSIKRLETAEYLIRNDTIVVLELAAHMPQQYKLILEGITIPVFTSLEDTIGIVFDCTEKVPAFWSTNKSINEFLLTTYDVYSNNGRKMRELYHQYSLPYEDLFSKFDSIKIVEQDLLRKTNISIPEWYRALELQNIEFKIAHFKLSAASYRNFLYADDGNIPSNENMKFLNTLNLSSPYNQYLNRFYSFMNFYGFFLVYGNNYVNSDSVGLLFNEEELATRMFEECVEIGLPRESLLAFAVHQTIRDIANNRDRKNGRIEYLSSMYGKENPAISYLVEIDNKMNLISLETGDQAHDFYLEDLKGNFHNIEDEKGKVLLLNFYTPGCIACVKEVPYEKELLAKYDEDEFQIINICLTDSQEIFKTAVNKFQLDGVNVYTPGNWGKILKKEYLLAGYPHYTLVDKKGQILKNNTYKPSNPKLNELIELALRQ